MDQPTTQALHRCLREIERRLGWGSAEEWSGADFAELSERILAATGVRLSPTTLKRVWGRIHYAGSPGPTTLDTLAVFAGADGWRTWLADAPVAAPPLPPERTPNRRPPFFRSRIWWLASAGLAITIVFALLAARDSAPEPLDPSAFSFSVRPVTTGIPNSVVFEYAAAAASTDSVFIQQSWDPRRRTPVARTGSRHTAIYYEPGYFRAKLVVGEQIVREEALFLPSQGWVVATYPDGESIPVYFPADSLRTAAGTLALAPSQIQRASLALQPRPPLTRYSYVDRFAPATSHDFQLTAELRNTHYGGGAVCQYTRLIVLFENDAIILPLSQPGCVAELELYAPGHQLTGATADLSPFGTDLRQWTHLSLNSTDGQLFVYLGGSLSYQSTLAGPPKPLVGARLEFAGTGAIRAFRIGDRDLLAE